MLKIWKKVLKKHLKVPMTGFFPYTMLFLVLYFFILSSYLQRILFLSHFRRKNINVFYILLPKKCLSN